MSVTNHDRSRFVTKTASFFKQLGFAMDVTEAAQSWDEQVMNAAAFAAYSHALQNKEITTLTDEVFRQQTSLER